MTISKIRVGGTDHDLRAKYMESISSDASPAAFYSRLTTADSSTTTAVIRKIYGNTDSGVSLNTTEIRSTGKNIFDMDAAFTGKTGISKTSNGWSGTSSNWQAVGAFWTNTFGYTGQICVYLKATANSANGNFRVTFVYTDSSISYGPYMSGTSIDTYGLSTANKTVSQIAFGYGSGRTDVIQALSISLADSSYDGTYEPYQESKLLLNIPTITGKLNGSGSSVTIFPNGMQSNGTTADELNGTTAIKRIDSDNSILATPQTYVLDEALQMQYPVVTNGMEYIVPTSSSSTTPIKMDVVYGNAADVVNGLPQNYISVASMQNFLSALGTQMNGTWTMQYSGGKYTFTFTSN